jgi:hypothetical protein
MKETGNSRNEVLDACIVNFKDTSNFMFADMAKD